MVAASALLYHNQRGKDTGFFLIPGTRMGRFPPAEVTLPCLPLNGETGCEITR